METEITAIYKKHKEARLLFLSLLYKFSNAYTIKSIQYKKILSEASLSDELVNPITDWLIVENYIAVKSSDENAILTVTITHEGIRAVEENIIFETKKPSLVNFIKNSFLL